MVSLIQAQTGVSYLPASGTVVFENGQDRAIVLVDLESRVFLTPRSNFTVTLTGAQYLGSDGRYKSRKVIVLV